MNFCSVCSNYLFLENVTDDTTGVTSLQYKCHNCSYTEPCANFREEITKNTTIDTTGLIYDMTFMRTKAIQCPKVALGRCVCPEVLYFRQKHTPQMLYVCCNPACQHQWTKTVAATATAAAMDEGEDEDAGEDDDAGDDEDAGDDAGDDAEEEE